MLECERQPIRILIIGGYGAFGGRLVELLLDDARVEVIVAGRSLAKARSFCAQHPSGAATVVPQEFDRIGDVATQLAAINPAIVVDASGPFQGYGADAYALVEACLTQGVHYLDIADSAKFVVGIDQFDARAKEQSTFVLAGASTVPALSGAALNVLTQNMSRVESIHIGIAPSPFATMGESVIRAVASYAGQPIRLLRAGVPSQAYGLAESQQYTISPPGFLPLRSRRFSLVDAPDLQTVPKRYPELQSVWVGAGTVPEVFHRFLNVLAQAVRHKLLPPIGFLGGVMHRFMNTVRWGPHRGGMFVSATGTDNAGYAVSNSWHLIAEGDDGPYIPSMTAKVLIDKYLDGSEISPGARAAGEALELVDFIRQFDRRAIRHGARCENSRTKQLPPYEALLGDAFSTLPEQIQTVHNFDRTLVLSGLADVERGTNPLANFVGWVIGFPEPAQATPVTVAISRRGGVETWHRRFGDRQFQSDHSVGADRYDRLVIERFGPLRFGLAVVVKAGDSGGTELHMLVQRWNFLGLPLPLLLAPKITAYEAVRGGLFNFYVDIGLPVLGRVVRYQGTLSL